MSYDFAPEPPPLFEPGSDAQRLADYQFRMFQALSRNLLTQRGGWSTIDVSVTAGRLSGGSNREPSLTKVRDDGSGSQGVWAYEFHGSREQEISFSLLTNVARDPRRLMKPRYHWLPSSASVGSVIWGMEYTHAMLDEVFPNTVILEQESVTHGTSHMHQGTEFEQGEPNPAMAGRPDMIIGRLYRAGDRDTYPHAVWLPVIAFKQFLRQIGWDQPYYGGTS